MAKHKHRAFEGFKQEEQKKAQRAREKIEQANEANYLTDLEAQFYFIAGYTSGGAPYGVRYEELETEGELPTNKDKNDCDADGIPF